MAACTRAGESKQDPVKPDPIPRPVPVPAPTDDQRKLLVQQHSWTDAEATYLAVTIGADPKATPTLDPLGARPTHAVGGGRHVALAAHDGSRWVHVKDKKLVISTMSSTMGGKPSFQVDLGALEPTALHLAGDALYVGSGTGVCWFDLAATKPGCVELVKRDLRFKAYDRFVREGDRLLAIDDEVMPMFADWFSLDATGRPTKRLGDWALPGVINGHYDHAALLATGNGDYTLFLVAPYGIMSGNGHDLVAIPIRDNKLVFDNNLTIQNADGKTPILEEHQERGSNKPPTLLAGTQLTPWTGLAVAPRANKVLIAAGLRGMLSVPADFAPSLKTATADSLGSDGVRDVRVQANLVFVLVHRNHTPDTTVSELVVLDATSLKQLARHRLSNTLLYDRFVD